MFFAGVAMRIGRGFRLNVSAQKHELGDGREKKIVGTHLCKLRVMTFVYSSACYDVCRYDLDFAGHDNNQGRNYCGSRFEG